MKTPLPPLTPKVDPQLKPSQPHHNMKVPSTTLVGDALLGGSDFLLKTPILHS